MSRRISIQRIADYFREADPDEARVAFQLVSEIISKRRLAKRRPRQRPAEAPTPEGIPSKDEATHQYVRGVYEAAEEA